MRKAKIRIILGDKLMIWYPYVQMKKMKTPYKIVDAEGVYLYTQDNKMIDSVSSWWCMIHGYKNKEINEAMKNQIDQFSHVMLGGLGKFDGFVIFFYLIIRDRAVAASSMNSCIYRDIGGA